MAVCNPSTKLSAVVHVGSLSVVARRADQTSHQQMDRDYELHGRVLDDCRQIMTNTSKIKVTKDAVDDNDGSGCESITLVPHSAIVVVSNNDAPLRRPCSDFTDMLRRLINCRIIIIIT